MGVHGAGVRWPPSRISVEALMGAVAVTVPTHVEHHWELRLEEFEDGHSFRRFECIDCGAVRFE
jgi:hypothetical protein